MKYLVGLVCLFITINVSANLLISPTRVNFDNRDRIKEVILINTTTKERIYRVGWSEKKAKVEGGYEELQDDDSSVDRLSPFIRFSPRQVRLAPGEKQIIKLQLRKKANMDAAEYRSHLQFTALPPEDDLASTEEKVEGMKMQINMLVSYSIPVLYHPISPKTDISIESFAFIDRNDDAKDLKVLLNRSSTNSSYGRLEVYAKVEGKETRIGLANNIAVFKELDKAQHLVRIPNYNQYSGINELTIKYIGEKEYMGQILAQRSFQL